MRFLFCQIYSFLFLGACFGFERQICSLAPKFMLFYFCCSKFTLCFYVSPLWHGKFTALFRLNTACAVLSGQPYCVRKRRFVCRLIMRFAWRNLYEICRLCLPLAAYRFAMINKIFFSRIFHQACLRLIYRRLRKIYKVRILNLRRLSRAKF